MPPIVETQALTKSYGKYRGIVDVDMVVNEGEVFGFLGPNGAGKTTTIRVLLDLIRATSGSAKVFGIESSADPVSIHRRLGYLPGEWNLYDRLTGAETIRYFANLRGGVDKGYVYQLVERLDLDPSRRFREYSKGNKQKVGLICALQHKPELLILDEPTSGLDPLIQQAFNEILFEAKKEGRTVFLSSHIISEVERTCDRVAIIREGRIVRTDTVEGVRSLAAHEVELRFAAPVDATPFQAIEGVANLASEGRTIRMLVTGPIAPVVRLAGQYDLVDFVSREPSLEEVFLSEYATRSAPVEPTELAGPAQ
jgi:ABC-2 type transport system ATP-binding protein